MVSPQHKDGNSLGTGASATHDDLALHVLHSLDQPICIVDADDCFVFANKSYTDKYGMGPESVRGVPIRDVIGEAFYDKRIKVLLGRAREEGVSEHSGWIDYPEMGRRRVTLDIRRYTYPGLADKNCLIIQCRDITERIELDQRRKKSLEFQEKLMG